jgi:drug/metabolite transporter (DMT)-like permease
LKGALSTSGATYARFCYAVPFAIIYVGGLSHFGGFELPAPNMRFAVFGVIGGVTQILATALLVYLFSFRNFAVGTTFSKTETVQAALFGVVILGEHISYVATVAIVISLFGVLMISVAKSELTLRSLLTHWTERTALIGIASGAFFGISAVAYRAASLSLGGEGFLMQAGFTLACVTAFQTVIMAMYLRIAEPGELGNVLKHWRVAGLVGISGMLGSLCWFTAMTIQNVAYVRALGQIELVFTFAASYIFFKERSTAMEISGIVLIVAGIMLLVLWR